MPDDDLDLELDLDSEPEPLRKSRFGRKPSPAAAPAQAGAPAAASGGAAPAATPPAVVPVKRLGLCSRIGAPIRGCCARVRLPAWNLRTFGIGVAVLVLLLLLGENWPPMRLNLIGLHADVPKAVVLLLDFALGFAVAWLILRRSRAGEAASE